MMCARNYRELIVWQKAMDFVELIYRATVGFPKEEVYGLTGQLRKSAVSIPSNIAEGEGRQSDGDFCRFLRIAHGSLREAETQILIAARLGYMNEQWKSRLLERSAEIGRLTNGLLKSLSRNR
jgi:four helix bundle protein